MDMNLDEADIQWKFLIGCLIRRELEKDTIDRLSMSLFNMNLLDFAVVSQNYPLCKVIHCLNLDLIDQKTRRYF